MTPSPDPFAAFSRQVDCENTRARLRRASGAATPEGFEQAEDLGRALETADPLHDERDRRWAGAIRAALGVWPGRVALAGALTAMLIVGLLVGRITRAPELAYLGRTLGSARPAEAPPLPTYRSEAVRQGLQAHGIAPTTPSASEQRFIEAMAGYGEPDFARRAVPLLREAIAADPNHHRAQFWLGVALLHVGHHGEAIDSLEAASRLDSANRMYKEYLVYAYVQVGMRHRALEVQRELMEAR